MNAFPVRPVPMPKVSVRSVRTTLVPMYDPRPSAR